MIERRGFRGGVGRPPWSTSWQSSIEHQAELASPGLLGRSEVSLSLILYRLTPWAEDVSQLEYTEISTEGDREIMNLKRLTEFGCSCTPKLLDYEIFLQRKEDYVPDGYVVLILMEKVPGRNLDNFHTFTLEERDRVRVAFGRAISEFRMLGFMHMDQSRRNLIWDDKSERCFIVDLEDVTYEPTSKGFGFVPSGDFHEWRLHCRLDVVFGDCDPMVPDENDFYYCNDEQGFRDLAARAEKGRKHYEREL